MAKIEEMIVRFIIDYYKKYQFYPSYDEIAKGVGKAKATIHTHMVNLEEEGVIIRKYGCSPQYRLINMGFIMKHSTKTIKNKEELTNGKKTGN